MAYLGMLRFQVLIIVLLANALYVQGRRGGGGGSDYDGGSSGGGGSSDGDSGGDSGPSPEEKARSDPCRMEIGHTNPIWLHRWVGTYYNGTVVSLQSFLYLEVRACCYLTFKIGN
jgi:hypothetical protein